MNKAYGQVGELIGNCQLVQPLRIRELAEIWYAGYGSPPQGVVVKLLRPEHPRRREFLHIARTIQPWTNIPQLVRVLEYGESLSGVAWVVMEYLPGGTLRQYLRQQGRLTPAQALYELREMLHALAVMHEHGIVHRDLKPDNIYLAPHRLVLGDWGLAKLTDMAETSPAVWGSAPYMSPEQLQDTTKVNSVTDFFSLALVIYEALCGERCYTGESFAAVLKQHAKIDVTVIRTHLRAVAPLALTQILEKMLEKNPALRPQCATEILNELHKLPLRPVALD